MKKKRSKKLTVLLVIVIIIVLLVVWSKISNRKKYSNDDWPKNGLATLVPEPSVKHIHISYNNDDDFNAEAEGIDEDDYLEYVAECKNYGFIIDAKEEKDSYKAYNKDGVSVRISYSDVMDEYDIYVYASRVTGTFEWPEMGLATLIPEPDSNVGKVEIESSIQLLVYVGETTTDSFDAYVEKCIAAGFDVGFSKKDGYYNAYNLNGDSLSLSYEGFNTMKISMYASKEDEPEETEKETEKPKETDTKEPETKGENRTGISAEFKNMMDSYESFMDDYVEFMKKYSKSSNPAAMLDDYNDFMDKYIDFMDTIDKVDESEMTSEELKYFNEVTTRVNKKLLETY